MKEKFQLIKLVIQQHAKCEEDYTLNFFERWFYTLKTVVAILLGRKSNAGWFGFDSHIEVAVYNFRNYTSLEFMGQGCDWDMLTTAYGFWDWRYCETGDGYP